MHRSSLFVFGALLVAATLPLAATESVDDPFELSLRHIGPAGNRVVAVAGVPGDPLTYYAGSASGGIFATRDGGTTWEAVFDDTPAASIGALAVAPSDPNVVWAGTGETFLRSNVSLGDGVYLSTDAGRSWKNVGLGKTGRIGRIVVDPRHPERAWVAALGHTWSPQKERGVFRTEDGGATWEHVLFVDEKTGAIDLVADPSNPRILYAATWEMRMWTAGRTSGGPGSGIHRSVDGGDTWERLEGAGLPEPPWGKIGLAMSADDPRRIYALIETNTNPEFGTVEDFAGVLWRSDDRAESWTVISADNDLVQRPLYYTRAVVAPDDALEVTFLSVDQRVSHDGGASSEVQNSGWDHHDMWIDPLDGDRRIVGHDGGVSITRNRGRTWERPLLPNAQMYRVATDDRIPYNVYGNRQDGSSAMGPSRNLAGETIPVSAWQSVGGCEVGFTIPVPSDPDRVWVGCYDGILELYDHRTGRATDASVWPMAIESWPAEDLRYRIQWEAPLLVSAHDPETVYYGSQYVHRTRDEGRTWELVSPDLTSADPELMKRTGGLTLDDAGPSIAPSIVSLAESPQREGWLWAGTNDGRVQRSRDGGTSWSDVSGSLPGLPPRGTVTSIEPSPHDEDKVYVSVDLHEEGNFETWIFRSENGGSHWVDVRGDLPQDLFAFAHCLREDPARPGLLFLGTEGGLWASLDDGKHWRRMTGLPPTPVYWLDIQEHFGDLVVATYGRGFWILDDLGALRQWKGAGFEGPTLLEPRETYLFDVRESPWDAGSTGADGTNPPEGALLHVVLPSSKDDSAIALRIRDAAGELIREILELPPDSGLHRVTWDLREESTPEIELRTRPRAHSRAPLESGGTRGLTDGGRFARPVEPGVYDLELVVDEATVAMVSIDVLEDPSSTISAEDRSARRALTSRLRGWIVEAAGWIDAVEWLRRQLEDRSRVLEARGVSPTGDSSREEQGPGERALGQIEAFMQRLEDFEGRFFDLRLTGARQDSLRWKRLLYSRLVTLGSTVSGSERAPNAAHLEVATVLEAEVDAAREEWKDLRDVGLPGLNSSLESEGAGVILLVEGEIAGSTSVDGVDGP